MTPSHLVRPALTLALVIGVDLLGDLYSIPSSGGSATRLTSGSGFDGQPRFSPDGKTIVFVSDRSGSENLYLMDPDGKNIRPLTRGPNQAFISPAWTPYRVGLGGHGQLQGLGVHWELWNIASGGMKPIGLQQQLGSVEAGKLADLMVLDANPLDDIKNTNTIRYVMKNGWVYDGNTLAEVWPRQRPLPKQWWMTNDAMPMPGSER